MSDLSLPAVEAALKGRWLGRPALCFPRAASTNDIAHLRAAEGASEGLLVLADEQTAGRGRLERTWWAPPGSSLLMSLLLRPPLPLRLAGQLPMCLGLGTVHGIAAATGLRVALKWPNDVVYAGRKLGGMLTELRANGDQLDYAVLGLGLNVNLAFDPQVLPGEAERTMAPTEPDRRPFSPRAPSGLAATAVSLSMIAGHTLDRVALLAAILERSEAWYGQLLGGASLHEAWAAALDTLGRQVVVTQPQGQLFGTAVGVTEEGALIVRQPDGGGDRTIWAGDVTAVR
jgi:BirA family biotin operon repressor/biotin-[acetyl-CoA-carboxylase] ligase